MTAIGAKGNEVMAGTNLTLGFTLDPNDQLLLQISNGLGDDQKIISNIEGVLKFEFLKFPTRGSLQFKSTAGGIIHLESEEKDGWLRPAGFSSNADLPEMLKNADLLNEIRLPAHSILSFPIQYEGAFGVCKSEFIKARSSPSEFRVKLLINVLESGKSIKREVISGWLPCKMMKKLDQ